MISVVYNETNKSIDLLMDEKGIDLLEATLTALRADGNHIHIYATNDDRGLSTRSPYEHKKVHSELVLQVLDSNAWDDIRSTQRP